MIVMIQSTFVMVDLKEDICLLIVTSVSNGFLINIDLYQELILKLYSFLLVMYELRWCVCVCW